MFNPGRFSMCTAIETAKFDPQLPSNVGPTLLADARPRREFCRISHDAKLQGEAKFVVGTAPKLDFR